MLAIAFSLFSSIRHGFQTRAALQAEIRALRHQLLVIQRSTRSRKLRLNCGERLLGVWLSRLWSGWRSALMIVKPETVIAWHRRDFACIGAVAFGSALRGQNVGQVPRLLHGRRNKIHATLVHQMFGDEYTAERVERSAGNP